MNTSLQISWLISFGFFTPIIRISKVNALHTHREANVKCNSNTTTILSMHQLGMAPKDIAGKVNLSASYVRMVIRRYSNCEIRSYKWKEKKTSLVRDKIIGLHLRGIPPNKIADTLKCGKAYVFTCIKGYNVANNKRVETKREKIIYMHHQGASKKDIASKVNCTSIYVTTVLREAGLITTYEPQCVARPIVELSTTGEVLAKFSSIKEASTKYGIPYHAIQKVCNPNNEEMSTRGRIFKYEKNI